MLTPQLAHGRATLPSIQTEVVEGSSTIARSLYLTIQGGNPAGSNIPSTPVAVNIEAGEGVRVTIPSSFRLAGEGWTHFVISGGSSATLADMKQLAKVPVFGPTGELRSFPLVVYLVTDDDLSLGVTVTTPSLLPESPAPGQRRGVTSASGIFEYTPGSAAAVGVDVLSAAEGRWLRVNTFNTNVADTAAAGGCAQDVRYLSEESVPGAAYSGDGSNGPAMVFWLNNRGDDAIPAGQRVMLAVTLNNVPRSELFAGMLRLVFRGYANSSAGTLRTTIDGEAFVGLDQEILFENQNGDVVFQDDLQSGEAYVLEVYPNFRPEYLGGEVLEGSTVKVIPFIAPQAGSFNPNGEDLGDALSSTQPGACVPIKGASVKVLKRSGQVNSRNFKAIAPTIVPGLPSNTTGRQIRINQNGSVFLGLGTILESEKVRAIVDLQAGISLPCAFSAPITITGGGILATLTYPSDGSKATIRSDYPDNLLAGNANAELNPRFVTVYVELTVEETTIVRKFEDFLLADGASQQISIASWTDGTIVTLDPEAENFGFFQPVSAAATSQLVGSFPAGVVRVAYAFQYDGSTVSRISHSPLEGCIPTRGMTLVELENAVRAWGEPQADLAALRAIPLSKCFPRQVRAVEDVGGQFLLYRFSYRVASDDDSATAKSVRPSAVPEGSPGEWAVVPAQDAVRLTGVSSVPSTAAGEHALFIGEDGVLRQRYPSNGATVPVGGSGGSGGGSGGNIIVNRSFA